MHHINSNLVIEIIVQKKKKSSVHTKGLLCIASIMNQTTAIFKQKSKQTKRAEINYVDTLLTVIMEDIKKRSRINPQKTNIKLG